MKKTGVIIDFNNIAIRAMFTCQYMGESGINNFSTERECDILVRKIATDLSLVLRTFSPERVIIACDAKEPWRNTLYDDIEDMTYKGNRERDMSKDWDKIFGAFCEFKSVLKNDGFVVTEIDNAEADDLAELWRNRLFEEGFNVIMVSSDKDWSQLVTFIHNDTGNQFCVSYNPIAAKQQIRKMYVNEEFMDWFNKNEVSDIFFSNYDDDKNKFRNIMGSNSKIQFEIIDPNKVLLEKIMCGDDGDNVPAFYDYYKNGKKMRVTPLKANHVFESLNIKNIDDLTKCIDDGSVKDNLEKEMKTEIDVDFHNRLKRQRMLVELNDDLFPKSIVRKFRLHAENNTDKGYVQTTNITMEDILKDTKYLKPEYNNPKENSIFDDINVLSKYSKSPSLF